MWKKREMERSESISLVFSFLVRLLLLAFFAGAICMAANSKGRALAAGFGKRFVNRIWAARNPAVASPAPVSLRRRGVHASSYDKNVDEQVRPAVVPDHVIDDKSDKYWGPHPATGVFGPADEGSAGSAAGVNAKAAAPGSGPSVLDQKVWFRPLEDVDKPPYA